MNGYYVQDIICGPNLSRPQTFTYCGSRFQYILIEYCLIYKTLHTYNYKVNLLLNIYHKALYYKAICKAWRCWILNAWLVDWLMMPIFVGFRRLDFTSLFVACGIWGKLCTFSTNDLLILMILKLYIYRTRRGQTISSFCHRFLILWPYGSVDWQAELVLEWVPVKYILFCPDYTTKVEHRDQFNSNLLKLVTST